MTKTEYAQEIIRLVEKAREARLKLLVAEVEMHTAEIAISELVVEEWAQYLEQAEEETDGNAESP